MAKKEDKQSKVVLERTYNVPLRRDYLKVPMYKRAKKAVNALRQFIFRHMKPADIKDIKIGKHLNHEIWAKGIRYPPHHIKIITAKYEDGIVRAELVGKPLLTEEKEGREKRSKKKSDNKERAAKKGKAVKSSEEKDDSKKTESKDGVKKAKEKETSKSSEIKEDKKAEAKEDKKAEAKIKSKNEISDDAESDDDIEYGDMSEDDFDDSEVVEKPKKKTIK